MSLLSLGFWALFSGCVAQFAGIASNQHSNQLQERLMLGMSTTSIQKRADVDIGQLSA